MQHTTGSYGSAGAVAAVSGVSMALFAPQSGKLADRFGQRAVLAPGVLLHAVSVSALTALALADAPLWALFAAAVPTGASIPQVGPMVRARWAAMLGATPDRPASPLMSTAAAFESVTDEFTFVLGLVIATALCTGVHPAAAITEAALTLVGPSSAERATQPRHRCAKATRGRTARLGALRSRRARPGRSPSWASARSSAGCRSR
ncbi:MFS transporter [Streptomyces badius]